MSSGGEVIEGIASSSTGGSCSGSPLGPGLNCESELRTLSGANSVGVVGSSCVITPTLPELMMSSRVRCCNIKGHAAWGGEGVVVVGGVLVEGGRRPIGEGLAGRSLALDHHLYSEQGSSSGVLQRAQRFDPPFATCIATSSSGNVLHVGAWYVPRSCLSLLFGVDHQRRNLHMDTEKKIDAIVY